MLIMGKQFSTDGLMIYRKGGAYYGCETAEEARKILALLESAYQDGRSDAFRQVLENKI
jgi:hypothetical protein